MSLLTLALLINFLLIIGFIFFSNKDYRSSLKWVLVFFSFPLISFVFYFFLGRGIKINRKRYQNIVNKIDSIINEFRSFHSFKCNDDSLNRTLLITKELGGNFLTYYNDIYYFCNGSDYYSSLLNDIKNAKSSIHIEIYIIHDDEFGKTLLDLLLTKANEGVKVKLVYDPNGNLLNKRGWLKKYHHLNIMFVKQFSSIDRILNFNYRNHRKIVIIDGKVAYLGGFNFGDEYLSNNHKIDPFRDTQIKIIGEGVLELQRQFLIDFYYAYSKYNNSVNIELNQTDFQCIKVNKIIPLQIISSSFMIRENLKRIKMNILLSAKKEIYIQTPYFVLDLTMMEQLKLLLLAKVKISIMIPLKYDKRIPFCASLSYARELYNLGADIYLYNGFIHAKTIIVDDKYLIVGSSNFDIRSFNLNLETDAFIYSRSEVNRYLNIYKTDIIYSLVYSPFIEQKYFSSFKLGKRLYRIISSLI